MSLSHSALLVAAMSLVTILLRALPFLVFRKNTPDWLAYLGKVLPPAIIGMLVVYCLKDTNPLSAVSLPRHSQSLPALLFLSMRGEVSQDLYHCQM